MDNKERIRDLLGYLAERAIEANLGFQWIACEKEDRSGLVLASFTGAAERPIQLLHMAMAASVCRLKAGGQTMAIVTRAVGKPLPLDVMRSNAAEAFAQGLADHLTGTRPDPEVETIVVISVVDPDQEPVVYPGMVTIGDEGRVSIDFAGFPAAVTPTQMGPFYESIVDLLGHIAVGFPSPNVTEVQRIMSYETEEFDYVN